MEVGEYIRTRLGISKIIRIIGPNVYEVDKNGHHMGHRFLDYVEDDEILKHSINVIELIEVGDYVNGYKVSDKESTLLITNVKGIDRSGYHIPISQYGDGIKSIVTKEQFASMEYKIEAEDK